MGAVISAISYYLPNNLLTNRQLQSIYSDWDAEKILSKTGISERRIADADECASDLAEKALKNLFCSHKIDSVDVEYILFCTQSPDYFLPTTACILQNRLGIPTSCGALDFNLGCSGYIYGLSLAKALVESNQYKNVLVVTSETYSKYIDPMDKSVRTLFGDAATATLITNSCETQNGLDYIGAFVLGSDGSGANNLIVSNGGMRKRTTTHAVEENDVNGDYLYMNGPEIFNFTIKTIPPLLDNVLIKNKVTLNEIDMFCFHQANAYMLEHLRKKLCISPSKFIIDLCDVGNTVSNSIPLALKRAWDKGTIKSGMSVALVGFGVGYSWGATIIKIPQQGF